MRKAVAIPYVIALIIGVVVVAVLAYWFISSGGKGASVGKEAECTARKVEFCASKTSTAWQKVIDVCKGGFGSDITKKVGGKDVVVKACYDFCSTIIPNWGSPKDRSECSPPA